METFANNYSLLVTDLSNYYKINIYNILFYLVMMIMVKIQY